MFMPSRSLEGVPSSPVAAETAETLLLRGGMLVGGLEGGIWFGVYRGLENEV